MRGAGFRAPFPGPLPELRPPLEGRHPAPREVGVEEQQPRGQARDPRSGRQPVP